MMKTDTTDNHGKPTLRRMAAALLTTTLMLTAGGSAAAQTTLYQQNMQMGALFFDTGNMHKAREYYQAAIDCASDHDVNELIDAQLALVDVLKFWSPVEAQRYNDACPPQYRQDATRLLRHLLLDGYISFTLNNRTAFNTTYKHYWQLLQDNDTLTARGQQAMEAMNQALNGHADDALRTLARPGKDLTPLARQYMTVIIYQQTGQTDRALQQMKRLTFTMDSLTALSYERNALQSTVTTTMTTAQQKAEQHSSRMLKIILGLAVVIIAMLAVWTQLRRKSRKQLEKKNEQLRAALAMANETDQMKTEFVRRVSHEIRTPLNAITGFNDILNNSGMELSADERSDLMNRINDNMKAITKIVNDMLKVAEAESTVDYEKGDTVMCNKFFSDIIYSQRDKVSANIELKYTTRVLNRFTIQTNAEAVRDMLDHMIHNAMKFTSRGSIELNCREQKGMVYLTLTDTGRGVPAEMQDKIFEQFAKGDAFQQGIGLGLTVSRSIARKMGGDLTLDKEYVQGARFVLSLPVK